MTETQRRFLQAIADSVGADRIVELYLLAPRKVGAVETGVAIVAARRQDALVEASAAHEVALSDDGSVDTDLRDAAVASLSGEGAGDNGRTHADPDELGGSELEVELEPEPDSENARGAPPHSKHSLDFDEFHHRSGAARTKDPHADADDEIVDDQEFWDDDIDPSLDVDDAPATINRLTVYTARYRLTLKGAERGRWETDVVEQADAPLAAVDEVVRGVQKRSDEEVEAERLDGDAFRFALTHLPPVPIPVGVR